MITNVLDTQAAPHLLSKARPRLDGPDHPDALLKACVTRAREFAELANYKSRGRLYRNRVALTVEANGGFDPNSSEDVIYLDCYLLPAKRPMIDKNTGMEKDWGEPPGPVNVGEEITFELFKDRKKDTVTVKRFNGLVTDVFWGSVIRTLEDGDVEERNSLTLGLIEVRVLERFERSLIMDSDYNLRKNKYSLPA